MANGTRASRDAMRRRRIVRYHELKDAQDQYEVALAAAVTSTDRHDLSRAFAELRGRHAQEDIALGLRSPGFELRMQHVMWATWIEIAVEHELAARHALQLMAAGESSQLADELRHSLVAISAAASSIDALSEELRYLIPEQAGKATAAANVEHVLVVSLGLDAPASRALSSDLAWLFERRNEGVHPYSESAVAEPHPSGVNSSREASRFNALESQRAIDVAMACLAFAASPPNPVNGWVDRWAQERAPYQTGVVARLRAMRKM